MPESQTPETAEEMVDIRVACGVNPDGSYDTYATADDPDDIPSDAVHISNLMGNGNLQDGAVLYILHRRVPKPKPTATPLEGEVQPAELIRLKALITKLAEARDEANQDELDGDLSDAVDELVNFFPEAEAAEVTPVA